MLAIDQGVIDCAIGLSREVVHRGLDALATQEILGSRIRDTIADPAEQPAKIQLAVENLISIREGQGYSCLSDAVLTFQPRAGRLGGQGAVAQVGAGAGLRTIRSDGRLHSDPNNARAG